MGGQFLPSENKAGQVGGSQADAGCPRGPTVRLQKSLAHECEHSWGVPILRAKETSPKVGGSRGYTKAIESSLQESYWHRRASSGIWAVHSFFLAENVSFGSCGVTVKNKMARDPTLRDLEQSSPK